MTGKYRRWTPSEIIFELKRLERKSPSFVRDNHPGLYGAAIRHFGTWKSAVSEAGIEYKTTISRNSFRHWTKEMVIQEILQLTDCHSSTVRYSNVKLYSAAIRIFTSWKDALIASGLDYDAIMKSRRVSKKRR